LSELAEILTAELERARSVLVSAADRHDALADLLVEAEARGASSFDGLFAGASALDRARLTALSNRITQPTTEGDT